MRPSRDMGEQGKSDIILGEKRPILRKTILGSMERKKTKFRFWGTEEQAILFQRNKFLTGGPQTCMRVLRRVKFNKDGVQLSSFKCSCMLELFICCCFDYQER